MKFQRTVCLPKRNDSIRSGKYVHRRALSLGYVPKEEKNIYANDFGSVVSVPPELMVIGYVKGAIGIKGDLKVVYDKSFKKNYKTILKINKPLFLDIDFLWIHIQSSILKYRLISMIQCKDFFRLNLDKINNREKSESLVGSYVKMPKDFLLKRQASGWNNLNLLNFSIVNLTGKNLGIVEKIDGNGFHDWIFSGEIIIPLVDKHVINVDTVQKQVIVDWEDFW